MEATEFTNMNPYQNLEYLRASNAEELLGMIRMIRKPVRILSIYAQGTQHFAWIQGDIKKSRIKDNKNG